MSVVPLVGSIRVESRTMGSILEHYEGSRWIGIFPMT